MKAADIRVQNHEDGGVTVKHTPSGISTTSNDRQTREGNLRAAMKVAQTGVNNFQHKDLNYVS